MFDKIKSSTVRREIGDNAEGDQRRFVVTKLSEQSYTMVPQELKEKRAILVKQIEDIDILLSEMDKVDRIK